MCLGIYYRIMVSYGDIIETCLMFEFCCPFIFKKKMNIEILWWKYEWDFTSTDNFFLRYKNECKLMEGRDNNTLQRIVHNAVNQQSLWNT